MSYSNRIPTIYILSKPTFRAGMSEAGFREAYAPPPPDLSLPSLLAPRTFDIPVALIEQSHEHAIFKRIV